MILNRKIGILEITRSGNVLVKIAIIKFLESVFDFMFNIYLFSVIFWIRKTFLKKVIITSNFRHIVSKHERT